MDTIFLKIISGEIPSEKIYEDEHTFSFLDINPNNKGHALVVPKTKYRNILDIDEETFAHMARTAVKVARAVKKATNADGVNITMNNEPEAGQEVFHAHLHVIPRFKGDNIFGHIKHTTYEEGEMAEFGRKIRAHFS